VAVVLLVVLFSWAFQRFYLPSTGAVPSAATMPHFSSRPDVPPG
jgi:hypothetical protein